MPTPETIVAPSQAQLDLFAEMTARFEKYYGINLPRFVDLVDRETGEVRPFRSKLQATSVLRRAIAVELVKYAKPATLRSAIAVLKDGQPPRKTETQPATAVASK